MEDVRMVEGDLVVPKESQFGIIAGRFNGFIVDRRSVACLDTLTRHGVGAAAMTVVRVPGAFEMPLVAHHMAMSGQYAAVIALGAIIRGETPHFDYVAGECASGLAAVARETQVPVIFGVLTVDSVEQAIDRAGTKSGNKGADAAVTAIEMASLVRKLKP